MMPSKSAFCFLCLLLPLSLASLMHDVELRNSGMMTIPMSSLFACSAECLLDICCLSFNFFQPTLECQLNFRTKEQNPDDFVPKKGSFYRNKDTIPESLAGMCGTSNLWYENGRANGSNLEYEYDQTVAGPNVTHNCDDVTTSHPCTEVYTLTAPEVYHVTVFCDMVTDGGGWLVFQRRMDGSEDFYRTWDEYRNGFGDVTREFWLGNEVIHQITNRSTYELRIDLEDFEGNKRYAVYSPFSLASEAENYTLHIGPYSGNAGDSFSFQDGCPFTTRDKDLDLHPEVNCAEFYHGAWWYKWCHTSNLNGWYLRGQNSKFAQGVVWKLWREHYYSLKRTEMKIRPIASWSSPTQ